MKGVPIKFRGKDGRIVELPKKYRDDDFVQLVGYDAEGNEVYEGDIIDVFNDGKLEISFPAALTDNLFHNKSVQLLRRNDK